MLPKYIYIMISSPKQTKCETFHLIKVYNIYKFYDIRILITPLVSSNSFYNCYKLLFMYALIFHIFITQLQKSTFQ
jgi:hypothetical protein